MVNSPPDTRASLILRLKNSDDLAAWEEFVELYGPVVFRVARRRGLQVVDAENLLQEVLIAVAKSLPAWLDRDDRGRFRAWLIRIAQNEAVDMLTERATRAIGLDGDEGKLVIDTLAVHDEISLLIEREYRLAVFRFAAEHVQQNVADPTWQAFILTEVEGVSVQEAARRLRTSHGNIYVSRSRVMARIKTFVEQYEASHE